MNPLVRKNSLTYEGYTGGCLQFVLHRWLSLYANQDISKGIANGTIARLR